MNESSPLPSEAPGSLKQSAVRAFDIRGVVGRDLNAADARLLGGSYAGLAHERGLKRIGVSRDGRVTSPELEAALVQGLVDGGLEVVRIGRGPTPQLAFAVRTLPLDGGIMVTASHNPPEHNGFKLLLGSERLHGLALRTLVARDPVMLGGGKLQDVSVQDAYLDELSSGATHLRPFKICWDCGSGATGEIVERLVKRLPGEHVLLNTVIDGRFPAHHADPSVAANMRELQAAVVANGCDFGIAFDGDGDRIGVVDGSGALVWADQLLLLLASDLLIDEPGSTFVADVKSSSVFFDGVEALGGRAVMVPSGYVLVRDAITRESAKLGGELSGHIFYADRWDGTDDALYVAMRLISTLSRSNQTLTEFRHSLPQYVTTPEIRIPYAGDRKAVVQAVAERLAIEGVHVEQPDGLRVISSDGWWLLRASGTESKLTCRCEARTEAGLERIVQKLRHQLRESGIELA